MNETIRRIATAFFLVFIFSFTVGTNPALAAACHQTIQKWDWCGSEWDNNGATTGLLTCVIYTLDATGYPNGYSVYKQHLTPCEADPTITTCTPPPADWLTAPTNLNHNLVNQISSSVDSSNPTYDDNGNYTSPTGYGTLIYDAEDRLVQASTGSYQVKFSYDGQNRRRRATSYNNGILAYDVNYLWCGDTVCQKSRANSTTVLANLFSEGVEFIGGVNAYYAVDHLGTPRDLVYMRNGDTLNARDHSPYGKQESISVNAYYGSSYAPEFPFAGMQAFPFALNSSNPFNMNSSEYLTKYRMYKPSFGRWLSRDPIAEDGGINLYGYVGGNPVNLVDPLGEFAFALPFAAAGAEVLVDAATAVLGGAMIADSFRRSSAERAAMNDEHKAAKGFCDKPPPPTGDKCTDLLNRINYHRQCADMKEQWDTNWPHPDFPVGKHATDISYRRTRADTLEEMYNKECNCS